MSNYSLKNDTNLILNNIKILNRESTSFIKWEARRIKRKIKESQETVQLAQQATEIVLSSLPKMLTTA